MHPPKGRGVTVREITSRLESFYIDVPALRPGTVGAYLLAFVSVGVGTALRLAIGPYVDGFQFATFLPAVILTTLISGLGAGLFSVVLTIAAAAFFVFPPHLSFYVEEPGDVVSLLLYTVVMLFNVVLITGMRHVAERRQDQQALQEGKDRLQLALDATQLGWWQYDPLRRVISGDTRSQELFNAHAGDIPIEDIVTKRLHSDDAQRVWEAFQAALDPADPRPYATQYQVERGAGDVRWVEAHGLAHFEGKGREKRAVSIVGTVQDITERKEREEKDHLLMREVNHRARNMLSVVDAIAHQTIANNPEDYVERFSERIRALAAYQDLLVRSEWTGVEIEDLARAQLSHFADLIGSRIVMNGPKLRLNPASAQAIGLALYELAANARDYGALSTDAGRVDIGWGTDGDTLTMSWTERGGPPVSPPKRRGFGSTVMATMAERTVGGKADLDYALSGLTWRLTCPAANALERGYEILKAAGQSN
jgi:PAS domain S-box-containing protein